MSFANSFSDGFPAKVLGIDEAGRGSILGDLVLAAVVVCPRSKKTLQALGLKDSKSYGSSAKAKKLRKDLAQKITDVCSFQLISADAKQVDEAVRSHQLNHLERSLAQHLLQQLSWDQAVLDGASLFGPLAKQWQEKGSSVVCLDRADSHELSVAAASILAKVHRDETLTRLFLQLPAVYHLFKDQGGGYCNHATEKFLCCYWQNEGRFPPFLRSSYQWSVLDAIKTKYTSNKNS